MGRGQKGIRVLRELEGGAAEARVRELCMVWAMTYDDERVSPAMGVRVWLATVELRKRREKLSVGRSPNFSLKELSQVAGTKRWLCERVLDRWREAGLLRVFDEFGFVFEADFGELSERELADRSRAMFETHMPPVGEGRSQSGVRERFFIPRRLLAEVLRARPSLGQLGTLLGHLVRSLYLRGRRFDVRHRCYKSWIATAFNIAEGTVAAARRWLVSGLKWLRCVARGGVFMIDPEWKSAKTAPTPAAESAKAAPKDQTLPFGNSLPEPPESGVCTSARRKPDPRRIEEADLKDDRRLLELAGELQRRGLADHGDHGLNQVFRAAAHAIRVASSPTRLIRNLPGLFVRTLRRPEFVTNGDEEQARRRRRRAEERAQGPVPAAAGGLFGAAGPQDDGFAIRRLRAADEACPELAFLRPAERETLSAAELAHFERTLRGGPPEGFSKQDWRLARQGLIEVYARKARERLARLDERSPYSLGTGLGGHAAAAALEAR